MSEHFRQSPAENMDRCCMGYPLGDEYRCWNEARPNDLWCSDCAPELTTHTSDPPRCKCPGCSNPFTPNGEPGTQSDDIQAGGDALS